MDLTAPAPPTGGYGRADAMRLLWALAPPQGAEGSRFVAPWDRFELALEASCEGATAHATVVRRFAADGVTRTDIVEPDLQAALLLPSGPGPHPGLALYHGSGGGIEGLAPSGALLASHGYAALVVGYFGVAGTQDTLCDVPLESLAAGVERLRREERVDPDRIAALGTSVGAEGALAMAAHVDGLRLRALVAVAPSSVVWQGLGEGRPPERSRWSVGGEPLPYTHIRGERLLGQTLVRNPLRRLLGRTPQLSTLAAYEAGLASADAERAAILAERIDAPLLLAAGGADAVWPAARMAEEIDARRGTRDGDRRITYANAGHLTLRPPGAPVVLRSGDLAFGGTREGFADAMSEAWAEILDFLGKRLS